MRISLAASLAILAVSLVAAAFLSGCQPEKPVPAPERPLRDLVQQAEDALEAENYVRAKDLYGEALKREELSGSARVRVLRGLSRSALQSGDFDLARRGLRQWQVLEPGAPRTGEWQKIKSGLIKAEEGPKAYTSHLSDLLDPIQSWPVRFFAGKALTRHYEQRGEPEKMLGAQRSLWEVAQEKEKRQEVVSFFRGFLRDLSPEGLFATDRAVDPEKEDVYPATLVRWEASLLRFREGERDWTATWRELADVLTSAGPVLAPRLEQEMDKLEEEHGRPTLGVALLLPLHGGYGDVGWKVLRGADVAQWRMTKQGMDVEVEVINTSSEGWLERVRELPGNFSIVGGPLRSGSWERLHQAGLHEDRLFFTFRSALHPGKEGKDAYRFFPSRRDQAQTLARFCRQELELSEFASLYPRGDFGRSMSRRFWNATVESGGELTGLGWYEPGQIYSWGDKVGEYLQVPEKILEQDSWEEKNATAEGKNATRNATIPEADFEAVFIPDSFNRARILIPEFFYYDQPDLVFLGPAMWGQEIKSISGLDMRYFRLTLLATGWWPGNPSTEKKLLDRALESTVQGESDFWVGLGYDFLRFAGELGQGAAMGQRKELNKQLADFSGDFGWSMGEISWSQEGVASQDLFVLQPVADGVQRARPDKLKERLEKASEKDKQDVPEPEKRGPDRVLEGEIIE